MFNKNWSPHWLASTPLLVVGTQTLIEPCVWINYGSNLFLFVCLKSPLAVLLFWIYIIIFKPTSLSVYNNNKTLHFVSVFHIVGFLQTHPSIHMPRRSSFVSFMTADNGFHQFILISFNTNVSMWELFYLHKTIPRRWNFGQEGALCRTRNKKLCKVWEYFENLKNQVSKVFWNVPNLFRGEERVKCQN